MIATSLRRELRDIRWSAIGYALGMVVYLVVMVAFFPTVRDNSEAYNEMLDLYPESLKEIFDIGDMTTLPGFIGAEVLSAVWPIVVAVFAILAATGFVAAEIERGTSDFWLSMPVERWRLLTGKIGALALALAGFAASSVLTIWAGALLVDESIPLAGYLALFAVLLAFSLAIAGYASLLSATMSERGKAGGVAALVTLLSYLAWIVASLSDSWSWLRFLSFFSAFHPQAALTDGTLDPLDNLVLLAIALAGSAAALVIFQRRDAIG